MNGACNGRFFFGPSPWTGEGSRGQISLNFNYKVNFKGFYTKLCVCVLTNERYKIYQTGFIIYHLGHAPGMRRWCARGAQGGQKFIFSNIIMWHIKLKGMTSRAECK